MISLKLRARLSLIAAVVVLASCSSTVPVQHAGQPESLASEALQNEAIEQEALIVAYQDWKASVLDSEVPHEIEWREDMRQLKLSANAEANGFAREVALRAVEDQFPRYASIWDPIKVSTMVSEFSPPATEAKVNFFRKYLFEQMTETDKENAAWIEEQFVLNNGWFKISEFGDAASSNAWLLVQHAIHRPDFMSSVLSEMQELYPEGEVIAADYALLFDRVQMISEKPQRYGSQFACEEGEMRVYELEDAQSLDALRSTVGLEPFDVASSGIIGLSC